MIQKIDDPEISDNPRMFAALRILEHLTPPTVYGHPPYWRAPVSPASAKAFIPSWNWTAGHHELPVNDEPITCDYNGAFLSAIGSVEVAHGQLKHADEIDPWDLDPRKVFPGYYLIDVFHWAFSGTIVSPLGTSELLKTAHQVWVTHPTLALLLELLQEGTIGELVISEAWVTERRCNFREWTKKLKVARTNLLDNRDKADTAQEIAAAQARYDAFKEGYGAALSMMLTGEKCKTKRPDWPHAVYGQHAATSWRKGWRFSAIGPLLSMGKTDEITVLKADLMKAILLPKPPVKWDPTGRILGHLKEKPVEENEDQAVEDQHPEDMDFVMSDNFEDVL